MELHEIQAYSNLLYSFHIHLSNLFIYDVYYIGLYLGFLSSLSGGVGRVKSRHSSIELKFRTMSSANASQSGAPQAPQSIPGSWFRICSIFSAICRALDKSVSSTRTGFGGNGFVHLKAWYSCSVVGISGDRGLYSSFAVFESDGDAEKGCW